MLYSVCVCNLGLNSHLLGKHHLNLSYSLFAYFGARIQLNAQAALDSNLSILHFSLELGWLMQTPSQFVSVVMRSHELFGMGWPGITIFRIAGAHHCTQLLFEMGVSRTICQGWSVRVILSVSASWLATIIDLLYVFQKNKPKVLRHNQKGTGSLLSVYKLHW
jgi:hypothetical protein